MLEMILYLEFSVRASIHFSLGNPNSIKVAKASEDPTAGIGFPLKKRQRKLQLALIYRTRAIITCGLYIFYPLFERQKRFFKEFFSENSAFLYG